MREIRVICAIAAAGAIAVPSALATSHPSINVKPGKVLAGARVHVYGSVASGCAPGHDAVTLYSRAFSHTHDFAGIAAVFATVRADGHYSVHPRIPGARKGGTYMINARCGGGNFGISRKLVVVKGAVHGPGPY